MAAATVTLPCSRCGAQACSFTVPQLPDSIAGLLPGMVALLNLRMPKDGKLRAPVDGNLATLFTPEQAPQIAAGLALVCAGCA